MKVRTILACSILGIALGWLSGFLDAQQKIPALCVATNSGLMPVYTNVAPAYSLDTIRWTTNDQAYFIDAPTNVFGQTEFSISANGNLLDLFNNGERVVSITRTGQPVFGPAYKSDEIGLKFWTNIAKAWPGFISFVCEQGEVCRVRGHVWRYGDAPADIGSLIMTPAVFIPRPSPGTESRTCQVCGTNQTRRMPDWPQ